MGASNLPLFVEGLTGYLIHSIMRVNDQGEGKMPADYNPQLENKKTVIWLAELLNANVSPEQTRFHGLTGMIEYPAAWDDETGLELAPESEIDTLILKISVAWKEIFQILKDHDHNADKRHPLAILKEEVQAIESDEEQRRLKPVEIINEQQRLIRTFLNKAARCEWGLPTTKGRIKETGFKQAAGDIRRNSPPGTYHRSKPWQAKAWAPCIRQECACSQHPGASFNGQPGYFCCLSCFKGWACNSIQHTRPQRWRHGPQREVIFHPRNAGQKPKKQRTKKLF